MLTKFPVLKHGIKTVKNAEVIAVRRQAAMQKYEEFLERLQEVLCLGNEAYDTRNVVETGK